MEVYKIGGVFGPAPTGKSRGPTVSGPFQEAMKKANQALCADKQVDAGAAAALEAPFPTVPMGSVHLETMALQQADSLLGTLEAYAGALKDPSCTLKRMAPLVDRLEQEAGALDGQVLARMDQAGELAVIVREITALARVEAFKYRRGDYVS